jgi:protein involved in polysaccharide export with SLBB domain
MNVILSALLVLSFVVSVAARGIKPGDVLEISVAGSEALSKKVEVNENGTVDYPLLQDRPLTGLSVREVMDMLTLAVAKVEPNNMVVVNLLSEYKLKVSVLGQVKKPGMVLVNKGASLQEVLLASEANTELADFSNIKLIRKDKGFDDAVNVDLEKFLATGDPAVLPVVESGDTYIVLKAKQSKTIKVLGAVRNPGFFAAAPNANLFDMIQVAGGQMENADLSKVRHITTIDGKRIDTVVDLREFWEDLGATDRIPKVKEGDMVIVYKKTITWSVFMDYIRDAVALLSVYILIQGYTSK